MASQPHKRVYATLSYIIAYGLSDPIILWVTIPRTWSGQCVSVDSGSSSGGAGVQGTGTQVVGGFRSEEDPQKEVGVDRLPFSVHVTPPSITASILGCSMLL